MRDMDAALIMIDHRYLQFTRKLGSVSLGDAQANLISDAYH